MSAELLGLQLINPPGRKRNSPFPSYSFVDEERPTRPKRNPKKKATAKKKKATPKKKKTTVKRKVETMAAKRNPVRRKPAKRKPAKRRVRRNPTPSQTVTAVVKARAATAAARKAEKDAKKAEALAKRRATIAEKKEVAALKKAKRAKSVATAPAKRKPAKRKPAKRKVATKKPVRRYKRKVGRPVGVKVRGLRLAKRRGGKKVKQDLVRVPRKRRGKKTPGYGYKVKIAQKNPGKEILMGLMDSAVGFGTAIALRAGSQMLTAPAATAVGTTAYGMSDVLKQIAVPAAGYVAAALAKGYIKKGTRVFDSMQIGAGIVLLESITAAAIKMSSMSTTDIAKYKHLVPGLGGDFDIQTLGEYIQYAPQPINIGEYVQDRTLQMGDYEVAPAMAEYIQDYDNAIVAGRAMGDDGYFEIEEALADDEASQLQNGYGTGVLAHTVFSD